MHSLSTLRNWFTFCFLLLSLPCRAIDSPYVVQIRRFSLADGLPNRTVLTIGQAPDGFIWLGTLSNAYRFDGQRFLPLISPNRSGNTPFNTVINTIVTDPENNLWFFNRQDMGSRQVRVLSAGHTQAVTYDGIYHRPFPFRADELITATQTASPDGEPLPDRLRYMATFRGGAVWQYAGQGRFRPLYTSPTPAKIWQLLPTRTRTLLVMLSDTTESTYTMIELSAQGRVLRRVPLPARLTLVSVDAQGVIYLSRQHRFADSHILPPVVRGTQLDQLLFRLRPDGQLTSVAMSLNRALASGLTTNGLAEAEVRYDGHHNLFWVVGKDLLFGWHPEHGVVFDQQTAALPRSILPQNGQLFIDRTGCVWVGSSDGVIVLTLEKNQFQHLPATNAKTPQLSVRGMVQVGTDLLVNADDVWRINLQTGQTRPGLTVNASDMPYIKGLYPLLRAHDGSIWSASRRLTRLDPVTNTFTHYPLLRTDYCFALWQDGQHRLWLGSDRGLSTFDIKTHSNQPFTQYNQYPELAQNRVNGFFPDQQAGGGQTSRVWVAASSGLYLLDTYGGIVARYTVQESPPHRLPANHITFVHPDATQPGVYWLATRDSGLIRWERHTGQYRQFTQPDGLSDNTIYAIYEDRHQRLWLPSNYGLMCLQKQTGFVQTFLPKDGIAHEEFNLIAHYRAPDGRLFLGGLNGITAFNPDELFTDTPKPAPLRVTQLQLLDAGSGTMIDQLNAFQRDSRILMQPTDRTFRLSVALLDYRYINQARLWYRIEGWQDKWQAQSSMDLQINGLPPGDYRLAVRIQNQNGQWVSDELTIPIAVLKPTYFRTWFLLLCALALVGAVVLVFRWRTRWLVWEKHCLEAEVTRRTAQIEADKTIIEQQAAELQESVAMKSRFFANVSHELRTPLTLLVGPIQHLADHSTEVPNSQLVASMSRNAGQLLGMVNEILDLTKLDAGQSILSEQPANLPELVWSTVRNFTHQAQYAGVQLAVVSPDEPLWLLVDVPKLETVLKNLLANALRYTPTGERITVSLQEGTNSVALIVSDTGVGIHPDDLPHIFERYYQSRQPGNAAQGGTGIGLSLAREYTTLWGGALTVTSQLGLGSTFTVTYPRSPILVPGKGPAPAGVALPKNKVVSTSRPATQKKSGTSTKETILLVDDNADIVVYLTTLLKPHYQLETACNGRAGLDLLQGRPSASLPRLIISDLMMPEMDGLTFLTALRQQPVLRDIPLIVLTAKTGADSRLQALRLGIADYLTKPFVEEELLTRIRHLLARAQERTVWQQALSDDNPEPSLDLKPENWLLILEGIIRKNMNKEHLQVSLLAELLHMSERQLYRRIKELTGLSPQQFIQEIRLQTAREWFETNPYVTLKEVAHAVGFQKPSYFAQLYEQRFGTNPTKVHRQPETLKTADPVYAERAVS